MSQNLLFSLSAMIALLPATVDGLSRRERSPGALRFWLLLAVALGGALAWTLARFSSGWHTGFAASLWLTIAATLACFAVVVLVMAEARRLGALLMPYLCALALVALLWEQAPERPLGAPLSLWASLHIAASILAYGFATLAAVAAAGVILRERALKAKLPNAGGAVSRLPAASEGERLQTRLLATAASLLAAGLASGMATQIVEFGAWLPLNHKTVLALVAFALVIGLLMLQMRMGLAGRRTARALLAAYLLLSLAYPGVKFVTDVLIGAV